MYKWNAMPSRQQSPIIYSKGEGQNHSDGHKVIDLGVIWKGIITTRQVLMEG